VLQKVKQGEECNSEARGVLEGCEIKVVRQVTEGRGNGGKGGGRRNDREGRGGKEEGPNHTKSIGETRPKFLPVVAAPQVKARTKAPQAPETLTTVGKDNKGNVLH
jgi:hypothetical protein